MDFVTQFYRTKVKQELKKTPRHGGKYSNGFLPSLPFPSTVASKSKKKKKYLTLLEQT